MNGAWRRIETGCCGVAVAVSRRHFIGGGCVLAACSPVSLPTDFEYADLAANRSTWDRVHHLTGDSLFRGNAIGVYADLASPSMPLYRFRSISSMANWALEASGSADRFAYMYPTPLHGNINPTDIRDYISRGVIRSGDTVILEDAGDHSMDPNAYQAFWDAARAAVSDAQPITSVMMDMFEFPAGANLASNRNFQYETPFHGRTMNDATRAAATAQRPYPGQTLLLPMRRMAIDFRNEMMSRYGLDPAHPDGVHIRAWLQMRMAGVLCKAVGARVTNVAPLVDYAMANLATLRYGSAAFDERAAALYVRKAFMSEPYDIITTGPRSAHAADR
jgi:hypothetical protein